MTRINTNKKFNPGFFFALKVSLCEIKPKQNFKRHAKIGERFLIKSIKRK